MSSRTADGLGFLGVTIDTTRNGRGPADREIGTGDAPVSVFVVAAREDIEIARETRRVVRGF